MNDRANGLMRINRLPPAVQGGKPTSRKEPGDPNYADLKKTKARQRYHLIVYED